MNHLAVGLLGCTLLVGSTQARAQGPVTSRSAHAALLSQQGQALLDAGQVEAACAKFEASEAVENRLDNLLRLADCYERAGRTASAWHTFLGAQAVAHAHKDPEREQVAARRVAALETKLTRILFVVPMTSRVPGLTVRLGANTVPPSSWGGLIPVDAGVQRVSASAPGYDAWSVDLDASRSEGKQFRVDVPTLAPAAGAHVPPSAARGNAYRTAGIVTGSVGLAGLGAGAVFSALSRTTSETGACVKGAAQCTPGTANKPSYSDASTVAFALGGALLATGVTLFVLAPPSDRTEKPTLRVAARYVSNGGRLQFEGTW